MLLSLHTLCFADTISGPRPLAYVTDKHKKSTSVSPGTIKQCALLTLSFQLQIFLTCITLIGLGLELLFSGEVPTILVHKDKFSNM
jgi:hypothetical protein